MKLLIPLLCLLIVQGSYADEEPAALVELRQGWEEARSEAQAKVDKLYFEELEQLKKNFVQAGNIADAVAVDNVIKGGEKVDNEPEALVKLSEARSKSLKKALTPIDKQYWQDQKKLKANFQKQGNLAGVLAADNEIKKVLAGYNKPEAPKKKAEDGNDDNKHRAGGKADKFKGFKMEFVVIGNPNNEADDTGYGAVPYSYRIGKYEVSRAMIEAYNAAADPNITIFDLTPHGGNGANKPATGISWNEAARFVNWLNTSQGYQAAYKFDTDGFNDNIAMWTPAEAWRQGGENLYRHKDAKYFLPSENEWYKAAYSDPKFNHRKGGYWDYATGRAKAPEPVDSGTDVGTAVYTNRRGPANITNAGGLSSYATMAQNGNAWEWCESAHSANNQTAVESRVLRGGGWGFVSVTLLSSSRGLNVPGTEGPYNGFRVAAVPE